MSTSSELSTSSFSSEDWSTSQSESSMSDSSVLTEELMDLKANLWQHGDIVEVRDANKGVPVFWV